MVSVVYLGAGVGINHRRGYQGRELLPNRALWTGFLGLAADGAKYSCACVRFRVQWSSDSRYDTL